MLRLLYQELRFRRNAVIGWGIGLTFLPTIYVGIYPQFANQLEEMQGVLDLDIYRAMGMNFGTFEDWVASTVILIVPLILAIYAVIDGTATLAGQEDDGKLELIVALPIPRWQIIMVKAMAHGLALLAILIIVAITTTIVFLTIEGQIDTEMKATQVFLGLIYTWPLVLAIGMVSLLLGTICPRRRIAALLGTVVVVVSYFGSNLAGMVSAVEKIEPLFLFTYLNASANLFFEGPEVSDLLILLAVALVAFLLAVFFFQIRDITVGAWPWQRGTLPAVMDEN